MASRVVPLVMLAVALLLAGCKVDAIAPVNLSDIDKTMSTGEPADLTARLLLTFASRRWCEDMGVSLVVALKGAGMNMTPVSCAQDPNGADWQGELRMPVHLTSIANSNATSNGDLTSLDVTPNEEKPDAYSVAVRLDAPRLGAARERLLGLPAAQDSEDASTFDLSLTIMVKNDLAKAATLDVSAMTTEANARIELPAGGVQSVTLSKAGLEKLMQTQSVEFFAVGLDAN